MRVLLLSAWHLARQLGRKRKMSAAEFQKLLELPHYRSARMLLLRWRVAMAEDLKQNCPDFKLGHSCFEPPSVEEQFRKVHATEYEIPLVPGRVRGELRSSRLIFYRLLRQALRFSEPHSEQALREFFKVQPIDESPPESEEHK